MATEQSVPEEDGTMKTQKAIGIKVLAQTSKHIFSTSSVKKVKVYPLQDKPSYPFFARPCPQVPRHGFVDSRTVKNDVEWQKVLDELAVSGEEVWEIVCMPFIKGKWSGVLTPSGITIGNGHDGATSGNNAKTIPSPCAGMDEFYWAFFRAHSQLGSQAGVKTFPYIEFVGSGGARAEVVQLRDGPEVALGKDYVPKTVKITQVIEASGQGDDLMEWEKLMKDNKGKAGAVVWHPGGSLSSHYAVQAIVHELPVTCQDVKPEVGSTLKASNNTIPKMKKADAKELAKVLSWALRNDKPGRDDEGKMELAIGALHAQTLWGYSRHLQVLRAKGIAYMLRYGCAAVMGELRHWENHHSTGTARRTETIMKFNKQELYDRDKVYERSYQFTLQTLRDSLPLAFLDYMQPGWSASFGGQNWAKCTLGMARLANAVGVFLEKQNDATWKQVVAAWNTIVNLFHNTGSFLNKFIQKKTMDELAVVPAIGLVSPLVATAVLDAESYGEFSMPKWAGKCIQIDMEPGQPKTMVEINGVDVRWQVKSSQVKLQIKLSTSLNRSYGAVVFFKVDDSIVEMLEGLTKVRASFAEKLSGYGGGIGEIRDGAFVVELENGFRLAVPESALLILLGNVEELTLIAQKLMDRETGVK